MKGFYFLLAVLIFSKVLHSQHLITTNRNEAAFAIGSHQPITILFDRQEDLLIAKVASLLQADLEMVTGNKALITNGASAAKNIIIIGTLDRSSFIKNLVLEKKINVQSMAGKWEAYQVLTISRPIKGIDNALVIVGSDRRGAAYGVFELSRQMGVSPWYWWADVPVTKKNEIFVKANLRVHDAPAVKYRGIFINDEAPALSNWTREKFGGFNHQFYEKVFELVLRLKGNYLWPAMWGNAFYDDDSLNRASAETYGIVIGTSHHEPLMRAHDEWRRYGNGKWNYDSNASVLRQFWKTGMERATNEKIVSIGMRGDGDEPMTRGTATALLERIVADQRGIIEEVTKKPASETPQLWALYKEVQDYYDKGMRVPDDVTLLLCDDNWGNIRKLPKLTDKPRKGGYGIYYHFDYVGGPRNYKWINTNNIARVWEQMHLAWEYGARQIWIVNVGDIKPMEFPISFFLDYAWDPGDWNEDNLGKYYVQWAGQQFGNEHAREIGDMLRKYSQYASRRKPELLDARTYDLTAYGEAQAVVRQWNNLTKDAETTGQKLPMSCRDAYYQLVLHPVKAFANLHEMYLNVALNQLNAKDSNVSANAYARYATALYNNDSLITLEYHRLANGKWNHMMSQTHIGYTYWQQPPVNRLPALTRVANGKVTDTATRPASTNRVAKASIPRSNLGNVFFEQDGVVSIKAQNWTKAIHSKQIRWKVIPDIGKDGDGITGFPVTASTRLAPSGPHVVYELYTYSKDSVKLLTYFSPTLNFHSSENGLQFAVSIDDEQPQVVSLNKEDNTGIWNTWVGNNIIIKTTRHFITRPGRHTVKYWIIDPAIVLQKLVMDFGGLKPSYMGPPETIQKP